MSIKEVLRFLGIDTNDPPQAAQNRVAKILTNLGFTKYRAGKDGDRENRYWREEN